MAKKQKRIWLVREWDFEENKCYWYNVYFCLQTPRCRWSTVYHKWVGPDFRRYRIMTLPPQTWRTLFSHVQLKPGKVAELVRTKNGLALKRGK